MWLTVRYLPTSLFSLRRSDATNTAAKSLIAPSPYSIKMALLNSIITYDSLLKAKSEFDFIRDLEIQYSLSNYICVNNCFVKIQKEPHSSKKEKNPNLVFDSSIGFREYIYYSDYIKIAFNIKDESRQEFLQNYLRKINYFGKRGSFFQYIDFSTIKSEQLPKEYSNYFNVDYLGKGINGLIAKMDDFEPKVKFDNVNTYSNKKTKRIQRIYCFKYTHVKSSKQYTLYQSTI